MKSKIYNSLSFQAKIKMAGKMTLLLFMTLITLRSTAQVALYEGFTAPFNPAANGWDVQNLSSSTGTNTSGWRQGNASQFLTAITGAPDDYFSADKYSTSSAGATNTISCWLITPTLNLTNGAILQFAIKSFTANPARAERLQVYYSFGTGNNVGNSVGSATNTSGTFTNIVTDINPNMSPNFSNLWSTFGTTYSLTGITTPTVGRIAFRYYIPNGGENGPNGNYIGLDEVRYQMPCNRPSFFGDITNIPVVCDGVQTPLKIFSGGANAPTTYTWFNGATTSLTAFTPTVSGVTEIWSLGGNAAGCQHLDISFVMVNPTPTVTPVFNPGNVICAGNIVTVTASGANTYTYQLGQNSSFTLNPIPLVAPNVLIPSTIQFSLTGRSQAGCLHKQTLTLTVNPSPTLNVTMFPANICSDALYTVTASGATSYSYMLGTQTVTMNPLPLHAHPVNSVTALQFTLVGVGANGCTRTQTVPLVVNPNPVVTVNSPTNVVCANKSVTLTANGAQTYSWSGAASSTVNPLPFNTGTTAGLKQFTVTGVSQVGCSANSVATLTVALCTGINNAAADLNTVEIYPNPFNDQLTLNNMTGLVEIYNELGQKILEFNAENTSTLNTTDLKAGIYILKLYNSSNEYKSIKLLKN